MTIGELAATSGVPASTIRYWERIGVLNQPSRVSGQRRYGPDAVHHMAVLRLAQSCGFRLDEMRHLLHGFPPRVSASRRWQDLAERKMRELDETMARLKAMRTLLDRVRQCKCESLSDCGRLAVSGMGAKGSAP